MPSDQQLIAYVQSAIRSGSTVVRIPSFLLENASKIALNDVRQLCAINGVKIEVEA